MNPELAILVRLQGIDLEIRKFNQQKASLPRRFNAIQEQLLSKEAERDKLKDRLSEIQKRKVDIEDEFELENTRLGKSQKKISSVKTNREYTALQKEINEIKKANTSREDELLVIMEEIASLQEEIKAKKKEITQSRREMKAEQKRIEELGAEMDTKIAALTKDRDAVSQEVRPDLLSKYNFIKDKRGGVAVAAVSEGACCACNMNIPPQLYNELLKEEKIFTCPSCQRLIYALKVDKK